jgi:hypothetical protein
MVLSLAGSNVASAQDATFIPYNQFVASLAAAQADTFIGAPDTAVASTADFLDMQTYLLRLYLGVHVKHSFMLGDVTVDCVPIAEQPGVRLVPGAEIPQPTPDTDTTVGRAQGLDGSSDQFGNRRACAVRTIPMRRATLEDLTRFRTLKEFLEKGPDGGGHAPDPMSGNAAAAAMHRYAVVEEDTDNQGAASTLNLWSPPVAGNAFFSLAQLWVVGGEGATRQTAEAGWIVYPRKFGNMAVLFIYFTPDNYLSGCYNLGCGFVQTNHSVMLGMGFPAYSRPGIAPQILLPVAYNFSHGEWVLSVNGAQIGYYPVSVYNGGQNSKHATQIIFGGETDSAVAPWPPMGSGVAPKASSNSNFTYVAFQENIKYYNLGSNGGIGLIPKNLTTYNSAPHCYRATEPELIDADQNLFFYFGGHC